MNPQVTNIAGRITLVRRYLAIAMDADLTVAYMDRLFGWSPLTWRRYERAEMRPVRDKVGQIVALCAQHGLTWATEEWIDYGKGEGPPAIGIAPVSKRRAAREGLRGEPLPHPAVLKKKRRSG